VILVVGVIFYALGRDTRAQVVRPGRVHVAEPTQLEGSGSALA